MDHKGKVEVAKKLATQLNEVFGKSILAVLLDGSVARGDDTEYSDIELRVVTDRRIRAKGMSGTGFLEFVYKDLATQLQFIEEREVNDLILKPTVEWPLKVCPYLEPTLVSSTKIAERTVQRFKKCHTNLGPDDFRPAIQWSLVWIWEMRGKVANMTRRKSRDVFWCAPAMAHNAALFVALLNRRYLHYGDSRYISEIESFPLLPDEFIKLFGALQSSSAKAIEKASKGMWENCLSLAESQGYRMKVYQAWSELTELLRPQ